MPAPHKDVSISMPLAYQCKDAMCLLSQYFDGWKRGWEVSNDTPEKAEKIAALQDGIEKLFHASAALTEAIQKAHK